jgi:hypothetical protein
MPAQTAENRLHSILGAGTYAIITMASESGHSLLTIETRFEGEWASGRNRPKLAAREARGAVMPDLVDLP